MRHSPVFCVFIYQRFGTSVLNTPWRHMFWSIDVLESGVMPGADADGNPAPGPLVGTAIAKDPDDPKCFTFVDIFGKVRFG